MARGLFRPMHAQLDARTCGPGPRRGRGTSPTSTSLIPVARLAKFKENACTFNHLAVQSCSSLYEIKFAANRAGEARELLMENAIAYIRVSTTEQSLSLEVQREKIEAYCKLQGLALVGVLAENGTSGRIPLAQRGKGKELARLLTEKRATHVVALKLDRLFRDAADALNQTKVWTKAGITLHLTDMG